VAEPAKAGEVGSAVAPGEPQGEEQANVPATGERAATAPAVPPGEVEPRDRSRRESDRARRAAAAPTAEKTGPEKSPAEKAGTSEKPRRARTTAPADMLINPYRTQ
jgi:hypothetical protein